MAYYGSYQNPYLQQIPQNGYVGQANYQQSNNGLIWVQGESGAKSYMVPPNSTVMLMDSESQRFYLKSTDASGMPQPLRIFEYTERPQNATQRPSESQSIDLSGFVAKAEFDAFKSEINDILKKVSKNGKSVVSGTESSGAEG